MKTSLKLILAAAAFALAPAAALAQAAPAPRRRAGRARRPDAARRDQRQVAGRARAAGGDEPARSRRGGPSNASVLASSPARTAPDAAVGQPTGAMGFQPQVTPIGQEALWFHNWLLMPIITIISLFVLRLLLA